MTRCIIADDEPLAIRLLESYVARIDGLRLEGSFTSSAGALERIAGGGVDIAFLDIQMPGMNGLELARMAREYGTRTVFVTAYRDFAVEGFRVQAVDYLLKPASFADFREAVERCMATQPKELRQSLPRAVPSIIIKSDYKSIPVALDNVLFVEGLKDYVKIHIVGRERPIITQMSLKALEGMLPEEDFMRVHRSYIIARKKVKSFSRNSVQIASADIPIGETYRGRVAELLS